MIAHDSEIRQPEAVQALTHEERCILSYARAYGCLYGCAYPGDWRDMNDFALWRCERLEERGLLRREGYSDSKRTRFTLTREGHALLEVVS